MDSHVTIAVTGVGKSPLKIVKAAAKARDADEETWCVFDRDTHGDLPDALAFAQRHGLNVALSVPCIELWFLLHVRDQRASISTDDARRESRQTFGFAKKPTASALNKRP